MSDTETSLWQNLFPWTRPLPSSLAIFSGISLQDANVRLFQYINPLQQQGEVMLNLYKAGKLGPHDVVVHNFVELRNRLMQQARLLISPGALAMSEYIKETPPTVDDLRLKYSRQLNLSPFSKEVSEMIMAKSIQTNPVVTNQAMRMRLFGITGIAMFPGLLTFRLYQAQSEDRVYEIFRAGTEVVGGTITAWRGVPAMWAATKVCVPRLAPKQVVVLHVVFNVTAATIGTGTFGLIADKIHNV